MPVEGLQVTLSYLIYSYPNFVKWTGQVFHPKFKDERTEAQKIEKHV